MRGTRAKCISWLCASKVCRPVCITTTQRRASRRRHARHYLERLSTKTSRRKAWLYCARQNFVKNAAALFLMTAVFRRTMWKYHLARAYRVVLLDAGHLCQTFCLVATWLGLAPFCTAALKDTLIEKELGIDGIRESVLYVAGVGLPATSARARPRFARSAGRRAADPSKGAV